MASSDEPSVNRYSGENGAALRHELISKATGQRYYLNNALGSPRLRKLRSAEELIAKSDRTLTSMASKTPHVCRSGCTHCCTHLFKVTALELETITFHLINNPAILEEFLVNYVRRTADGPAQAVLNAIFEGYASGSPEQQSVMSNEYFKLKIRCAFVGQQGGCQIYPIRPLVCAGFISDDVAECIKQPAGYMTSEMHQLLTASLTKLKLASKKLDFEADLSTMILRHLEDFAERGRKSLTL